MKFSVTFSLKRFLLLPIAIAFLLFIIKIDAAPFQELEPRNGWIGVYIRHGDEPLSEINPKLAEAFHENENDKAAKVESANLTLEEPKKAEKGEAKTPEKSVQGTTTSSKEATKVEAKDSDVASFDVVKALDKAQKDEQIRS